MTKAESENPENTEERFQYRSKVNDTDLYTKMKEVHDKYTTEDRLHEIHHPYSSQKNEAMNKAVTKFAPKDRVYSKSMSLKYRVWSVAGIDSIGLTKFYRRIFRYLHIAMPPNLEKWLYMTDAQRDYQKKYQKRPAVKKKRAKKK